MPSLLAPRHKLEMQSRTLSSIGILSYLRIYEHTISTKISCLYHRDEYFVMCYKIAQFIQRNIYYLYILLQESKYIKI